MNAKMPELKRAFEAAGFTNIKTVLSSGNVVFDARKATEAALERKAEVAMQQALGRTFYTIVRPVSALEALLATDPYANAKLAPQSKRVVSFLRDAPQVMPKLPVVLEWVGGALCEAVPGEPVAEEPRAQGGQAPAEIAALISEWLSGNPEAKVTLTAIRQGKGDDAEALLNHLRGIVPELRNGEAQAAAQAGIDGGVLGLVESKVNRKPRMVLASMKIAPLRH
mgnify:CR=1 FL=1